MSETTDAHAEAIGLLQRQAARRPQFFDESGLDQLFSVVIELAAEVWVLRERLFAVEAVSDNALVARVEAWQASPAQAAQLAEMRRVMLQNLFRTIDTGVPPVSYEGETADPIAPARAD